MNEALTPGVLPLLDVAQLIKHAWSRWHIFADALSLSLSVLGAANWPESKVFLDHRTEVARFARSVRGDFDERKTELARIGFVERVPEFAYAVVLRGRPGLGVSRKMPAGLQPPWFGLCLSFALGDARRLDCSHLDRVDAHRLRRNHLDDADGAFGPAQSLDRAGDSSIAAGCARRRVAARFSRSPNPMFFAIADRCAVASDDGVVGAHFLAVLLRRHAERRQVPPQRFESAAVVQTDQIIRRYGLADRHRGRRRLDDGRSNLAVRESLFRDACSPSNKAGNSALGTALFATRTPP